MKPQNPYVSEGEPTDEDASRVAPERAAELAMESDHQAFAGSAEGVGSVEFDDPGAFGVEPRLEPPAEEEPEA